MSIQLDKLKIINSFILKDKITRKLIPIKEYSIYKKNSQFKILIKYKNHLKKITSCLITINLDGSIFVNLKNKKIKYDKSINFKFIFKQIESFVIYDIKYPSFKYNNYPKLNTFIFNKIIFNEINKFNITNKIRVSLIRGNKLHENNLLIIRKDKNYQITELNGFLFLKVFKNNNVFYKKRNNTINYILKELNND